MRLRISIGLIGFALAAGQAWGQGLPLEPAHEAGAGITGAFEGWFKYPDGSYGLLLGYFNRNTKQALDIPIGPENRIEPGGPDRGQPTHFLPGHAWGMFTIKLPSNFGDGKLTWTIVANGLNTVIPASLKPDYEIAPFQEAAVGNTPPVIGFDEHGPTIQGPGTLIAERSAKLGSPLELTAWVSDDAKLTTSSGAPPKNLGPPVTLHWSKYRGPGMVTFMPDRPELQKIERKDSKWAFNGRATTSVTFGEPGEYMLHLTANDYSGEGGSGFQCCWTTVLVKVSVER